MTSTGLEIRSPLGLCPAPRPADRSTAFMTTRPSGRAPDALRAISIEPGFAHHAEGSALIRMGGTEVLCAATVESRVPPFLRGQGKGWVTAEYGMLPRATHTRGGREAAKGKQSGRTQEIQRLIGRSLRAVVDLEALGEMSITVDCDVLNADGGTRCASITGAWVALRLALETLVRNRVLARLPLTAQVAAVSCGLTGAGAVLDLDYDEDSAAAADANFVLTETGGIVEIQATAEHAPFAQDQFDTLLRLARTGTAQLFIAQRQAVDAALTARTAP
ncbi:putative Ribonuclease PH [Gluconacetobacter diazotrophicus PA1 5]|uniref:Ribonuclease PH n=2 Tax=Gluconacetobacter diazotrophicus TaxID=33996 RepID=A9HF53_GLUDA|nr:putative Ribonuclease PH [Gluconacetobacter diazotrophicus PA1 5]